MTRVVLVALISLILHGCASTALPPVRSGELQMEEDERRLWARSAEETKLLNKSGILYHDEELERYLADVSARLFPPDVFSQIPFRVRIIRNPYLSAFTYPNGAVYLHTGILARMENEAQLATLLAHEMSHCTHRHTVRQFRDVKDRTAFAATFSVMTGGFGILGSLASLLGSIGTVAAVAGHSRELESEADTEGFYVMLSAGYDPSEASRLFSHLKQEVEEQGREEPFFFGTHPRLQERISNYEALLKALPLAGGEKNAEVFLARIQPLILDNAGLDLKTGRFVSAEQGIEKYVALNPADPKAYFLLGEVYRQRDGDGDLEKALEHYELALRIDPSYTEPYRGKGLVYYKRGEKRLAREAFGSYLRISRNSQDKAYIEEYLRECGNGGEE